MTIQQNPIPEVKPALARPLAKLEANIVNAHDAIENWFIQQWQKTPAPLYASVDLRNAGFKIAPVDTNLFSAGFNNLSERFLPHAARAATQAVKSQQPDCKNILIIPESHTRNLRYLTNVLALATILENAGFTVKVGSLIADLYEPTTIDLDNKQQLTLYPITRHKNIITIDNFTPDLIILNHDMSEGVPSILEHIEQPIRPDLKLGWSNRSKSQHFKFYQEVTEEFCQIAGIEDPWLINPTFSNCGEINFKTRSGEDCLVRHTTHVLNTIKEKYAQYGIVHPPFVIVKTDAGSYGMGVMTLHQPEDIQTLNRKERNKMSHTKGQAVDKVIIQEGVYTFETWGEAESYAEPVVYMMGEQVIGGFYRVHTNKGPNENLNAPGMHFEPLAFTDNCLKLGESACSKRFYVYGVIARLALIAAAREIQVIKSEENV